MSVGLVERTANVGDRILCTARLPDTTLHALLVVPLHADEQASSAAAGVSTIHVYRVERKLSAGKENKH